MDRMCSLRRAEKGELSAALALLDGEKDAQLQAFYEQAASERRLHVLRVDGSDEIVGAVVTGDAVDTQQRPAIALGGLRVHAAVMGTYDAVLSACELIGKLRGKESLIIACPQEDEALAAFCARRGMICAEQGAGMAAYERAIEMGCSCGG